MGMTKAFGPLLEIARIQSEINHLFDNLLDLRADEKEGGAWLPNVDIRETEDTLVLEVELPGVEAADLALSVHGGNVVIEGQKARPEIEGAAEFQVAERSFGRFHRVVHLGLPVNTRQAEAVLKDGLLRLCFPKVPNRRGEPVPIEVVVR
jgi:HSP20 family protein